MAIKYSNLYFVFFSLALSAALFPTMLGHYTGYIVPLGVGIFILDELIVLTSLFFMFLHVLRVQKVSYKVSGYGVYILIFLLIVASFTLFSVIRSENLMEIISRDRWIVLNSLIVFLPFVYKPSMNDMSILCRRFIKFIAFLTLFKLVYFVINGSSNQFSEFGPGFLFMLSLSLSVFLWSDQGKFKKVSFSLVALAVSFLGQQLSSILLMLICIFIPVYFLIFQVRTASIVSLLLLGCASIWFFINVDLAPFALLLNFNPLHFTIVDKLIVYRDLWITPFIDVTPIELFFGRGAGYLMEVPVYNEFSHNYSVVNHSLAHNFLVTLAVKFGLLGLFVFLSIISVIFLPLHKKFRFKNSTLLKMILLLIMFNFLSTPGIWKIRKGVFLWFVIGSIYLFRKVRSSKGDDLHPARNA